MSYFALQKVSDHIIMGQIFAFNWEMATSGLLQGFCKFGIVDVSIIVLVIVSQNTIY